MKNPHDLFFKESFNRKDVVKEFLDNYLPGNILDVIDTDNMEIEKDTYTDKEMKEYFSDIVYKVSINKKKLYLCFLFEHKSYPYPEVSIQVLRYMVKIWELKVKQGLKKIPLVIPLLIYHGQEKWNIDLKLRNLVEVIPEELENYFPDFEYLLYDFSKYTDEEIKGYGILKVYLEIISSIYRNDFAERVSEAIKVLEKLEEQNAGADYFESVIRYILKVKEGIEAEGLKKMVSLISAEKGENVMTIAESFRQEGIKEGRERERIEIARNLLKLGIEIEKVMKTTNLSEEKINLIKEDIKH